MKIYQLQKQACRIILNYDIYDMAESMNKIKVLTIYERIFLRKAKFMFKVFIQEAPLYIRDMFEPTILNNESRISRSSSNNNFVTPKPNKELFKDDNLSHQTILYYSNVLFLQNHSQIHSIVCNKSHSYVISFLFCFFC